MSGALTLRFTTQAQIDIRRMTNELSDLQRQVASGAVANDLRGFGGAASRILNAGTLKASADAQGSVIDQLLARFGVQGAALGQVANAASLLSQSIRDAISSNDGRGIHTELELSFSSAVSALNETWNGQPMFAGERQGQGPVSIGSVAELMTTVNADIFDEAERHQTIDFGGGTIRLAAKASELAGGLFNTLRSLGGVLQSSGGTIGQPIPNEQRIQLQAIADQLDAHAATFTTEEGRAGQLESRFEAERARLQQRSNLLLQEIGSQADADLATVSVKLSSLLAQYQAAAKTFAELSGLSLLDYL